MRTVFADSAGWIALLNTRDELHDAASAVFAGLRRDKCRLLTTEFILLEVADALSAPAHRSKTVAFIEGLRAIPTVDVVAISSELMESGWDLFANRPDKEWGLTDCISFHVMELHDLTEAFTSDNHFVQAGFIKLL